MSPQQAIREAVNDGVARVVAVVGLCGVALIHLLDAPGKFTETPSSAIPFSANAQPETSSN
jgi:hypothetical protein